MNLVPERWALLALLCVPVAVHAVPARPVERPVQEPAAETPDPAHVELMRFLLGSPDEPGLLRGARVAILATDGVDGFNLEVPRRYLAERGAQVDVIVPRSAARASGPATAPRVLHTINPSGEEVEVGFDRFVDEVDPLAYQAVYLPGNRSGVPALNGPASVDFIASAVHAGRPLFAIGNAPLVLLEAGLLEHRRATGDATIFMRLALSNAAATDAPLVKDGAIHTSRDAFDIPVLMRQLIVELLKRAPQPQ